MGTGRDSLSKEWTRKEAQGRHWELTRNDLVRDLGGSLFSEYGLVGFKVDRLWEGIFQWSHGILSQMKKHEEKTVRTKPGDIHSLDLSTMYHECKFL